MTTLASFVSTPLVKAEQTYLLTLGTTVKNARSLAYAKALAPQMFARLGTQVQFQTITITEQLTPTSRVGGRTIAIYNRKGWHDVEVTPRAHKPATILQFPLSSGAPQTEGIPVPTDDYAATVIDVAIARPNGVVVADEEVAF